MPKAPFVSLKGFAESMTKLTAAYASVDTVFDHTLSDMVSRVPGKIASSVTWMYGIKKSEIKYNKEIKNKSIGKISVNGNSLSELQFVYKGRLLTPLHFGMTPKTRPEGKKKYKVKAKIKKRLKAFPSKPKDSVDGGLFIAPAQKGSSTQIPFYRYSKLPSDVMPVKTLSLPQMIDNKLVRKKISEEVDELFHKRFDHHLSRHLKRCL
jgi:hypothetical protein